MRRVVRNSAWTIMGEAVGGALMFLAFVLIARYLGASSFGTFSYLLAVVGLFQVVADFGFTTVLVRDMARDLPRAAEMFAAAAALVSAISLPILAVVSLLAFWWAASTEILWACLVMAAAALIAYQNVVLAAACRAHEDMGYNAAGSVLQRLVLLGLSIAAIQLDGGMLGVALAYMASNLAQALLLYLVVRKRYFPVRWHFAAGYWKHLLFDSVPVGAAILCRRSSLLAGTLSLGVLATPYAVGLFSAAVRIMQIVELLSSTLSAPLLPPFSRLAAESSQRLFRTLADAFRIFTVIGLPFLSWIMVVSPALIAYTFGPQYAEAVPCLQIMSLTIFLFFPTGLFRPAFIALNGQRRYAVSTMICLAVTVIGNVTLVPELGARGSALALVAGELAFFACGYLLLRHLGFRLALFQVFGKPVLAAALASLALLGIGQSASVPAIIGYSFLYGSAYVLLLYLFKAVRPDELAALRTGLRARANT